MRDIQISAQELVNMNHVVLPSKAKEFSDYTFWYYTGLHTANLILANKCIHISNLSGMNDVDEAAMHEKNKDFVHCFCLCNSDTEKIPMWYLYSGITGKGISLGFTPAVMLNLINSIETITTPDKKYILHKGVDFELDWGWVFYRKRDSISQVMYKRKWYSVQNPLEFERDNYFIKSYPWEYEKEFRIVIHNKTNIPHERLVIDISSILNRIKLKLAPELSNESFKELLSMYTGLASIESKNISNSKLLINMQLCKRNFDGFVDYIKFDASALDRDNEIEYDRICKAISSKCKHKGES